MLPIRSHEAHGPMGATWTPWVAHGTHGFPQGHPWGPRRAGGILEGADLTCFFGRFELIPDSTGMGKTSRQNLDKTPKQKVSKMILKYQGMINPDLRPKVTLYIHWSEGHFLKHLKKTYSQ